MSSEVGTRIEVTLDVYNVGTDEEDDVLVTLKNAELDINEREHIRNMDVGDKKEVTFFFTIPSDADPKEYDLRLMTYFDYDEDDILSETSYDENSYEDLEESYNIRFEVTDSTPVEPTTSATLTSDAIEGQDLVVQATITNNDNTAENFVFTAEGYESWAELVSVSPQLKYLEEGESAEVTITLRPTEAGTQTFNIQTIVDGETTEQPVSVSITEKAETGFLTGAFAGAGTTTYLVTAIVIVLVLIIITLIVKLSRAPRAPEF
jgi:hypothetical protein